MILCSWITEVWHTIDIEMALVSYLRDLCRVNKLKLIKLESLFNNQHFVPKLLMPINYKKLEEWLPYYVISHNVPFVVPLHRLIGFNTPENTEQLINLFTRELFESDSQSDFKGFVNGKHDFKTYTLINLKFLSNKLDTLTELGSLFKH